MSGRVTPPKTLKERYGSLRAYLDATIDIHGGLAYRDFLRYTNPRRKHKIPAAVAAEDFKVSRMTWYSWIKWREEEQGPPALPDSADSPG